MKVTLTMNEVELAIKEFIRSQYLSSYNDYEISSVKFDHEGVDLFANCFVDKVDAEQKLPQPCAPMPPSMPRR